MPAPRTLLLLSVVLNTACIPEFGDSECFSDLDCDPHLCVENRCVRRDDPDHGVPPDEGLDPDQAIDPDQGPAPDMAEDPDMADDPDVLPVDPPLSCVGEALAPEGGGTLLDLVERAEFAVGGPPAWRQLVTLNLDGDAAHTIEHVVARGGRVEVIGADGTQWWRSGVIDALRIEAVVDFDGDGPREVLVAGQRQVQIYAGSSGRLLWSLPLDVFAPGEPPLAGIERVLVGDVTGDGLPDLYATEAGCAGGRGDGVFFSFGEGFADPTRLGIVSRPSCTRNQLLGDLDGDGRLDLVTPEADGIHVNDARSGERTFCGDVEPGNNGVVTATVADLFDTPGDELVVLRGGRISFADLVDGALEGCDAGQSLRVAAQVDLGANVDLRGPGTGVFDVDGDGALDVATSAWFPDPGEWRTLGYASDGRPLFSLPDAMLLATPDVDGDGRPELLVARGQGSTADAFAPTQLFGLGAGEPEALWAEPIERAGILAGWPTATVPGITQDLYPPVSFRSGAFLLRDVEAPLGVPESMDVVGAGGPVSTRPLLHGRPGGAYVLADPADAARDLLGLALGNGRLVVLDAELEGEPTADAQTGAPQLVVAEADAPLVVAHGTTGVLAAFDVSGRAAGSEWSVALGVDVKRPFRALAPPFVVRATDGDMVVAQDFRDQSRVGWAGVDVTTGDVAFEIGFDAGAFTTRSAGSVGSGDDALVLTYQLYRGAEPLPGMPCDLGDPDLDSEDDRCPGAPVTPRIVTASHPDGRCAWRAVLRPNTACGGNGELLSTSDGEIYLTESNGLHRLGADGRIEATADLGFYDPVADNSSSMRGGGRVTVAGDLVVRAGGNGPVDVFDRATLELVWRADHVEGVALQTWLGREAAVVDDEVWVSPGPGAPIHRYALADGEPRGRLWLSGGQVHGAAPAEDDVANVRTLQALGGVVLATADDGFLYGIHTDGEAAGALERAGVLGRPLVADVDGDPSEEMVVPVGDGNVFVHDRAELAAPGAAWDVPCPPSQEMCDPALDIDVTERTDELCAQWTAVADATSYDTRIVGPNGAVIRPWGVRGVQTFTDYAGLALVPDLRYEVQIRAWRPVGDQIEFSEVVSTADGVRVKNPSAPVISRFVAAPDPVPADGRTNIVVEASDEDRIAGWSLTVYDEADAQVVRLVNLELAHPDFRGEHTWDGTNRAGERLVGDYRIVARVVDRGGREATGSIDITLL